MISIQLNSMELTILRKPIVGQGGFQSMMNNLRARADQSTGNIEISDDDLERIQRYAFQYGGGGFEARLRSIFERTLGPNLSNS